MSWQSELKEIFKCALKLRIDMERNGSGEYNFEFPTPGERWYVPEGEGRVDETLLVGLFPSVSARFTEIRGGEWTEWGIVYDGTVDLFKTSEDVADDRGEASAMIQRIQRTPETVIELPDSSALLGNGESDNYLSDTETEDDSDDENFTIPKSKSKLAGTKRKRTDEVLGE
jgi:hypothetical protein